MLVGNIGLPQTILRKENAAQQFADVLPWLHKTIVELWIRFGEWLSQPTVYPVLITFCVTLLVVYFILSCVGFTPQGVAAASLAAGFQSWAYGGFTPASGVFATLTSIVMLGFARPFFLLLSLIPASIAAAIAWAVVSR